MYPPNVNEVKLTIKYPENFEISRIHESANLESEFLDLNYNVEKTENSITLTYKKIYKKSRIKASEFKKYAIMAEKYDEIENAKLILRKKR